MNKPRKRWKFTTVRKWNGDDQYSWAVFVKGQSVPVVSGLSLVEVAYYRERIEQRAARQ